MVILRWKSPDQEGTGGFTVRHEKTFRAERNIHYLDWTDNFKGLYMSNLLNGTRQASEIYCNLIIHQ